jgi:hypothetical protein
VKRFGTPYLLGSLLICAVGTLIFGIQKATWGHLLGTHHYSTDGTDLAAWYSGWATAMFVLSGLFFVAAVAVVVRWYHRRNA